MPDRRSCSTRVTWAAELNDVEAAPVLYDQLLPFAGLQAIGMSCEPYAGPVALALGRLAVLLGRLEVGRRHLLAAARSREEQHALPHPAMSHAALAASCPPHSRNAGEHADIAARLARRLGMEPLLGDLATRLSQQAATALSPGELEVARLVADGRSNAAIAEALVLSQRTVENQVSHILHKLG